MGLFGRLSRARKEEKDECQDWRTRWGRLQGIELVRRIEQTANSLGTNYREQQVKDLEDRNFVAVLDEITLLRCDLKALREEISTRI